MIIYNKEWLNNLRIGETAEKWFRKNLINKDQRRNIHEQYVCGYKKTNLFIRIGMFIFAFILASSAIGLVMLFIGTSGFESFGILFLLFAGIIYFVLRKFVTERYYFCNGIDDVLLHMSLSYFIVGISVFVFQAMTIGLQNQLLIIAIISLPVLIFGAIRFADSFATFTSYLCLLLIMFLLVSKTGSTGKALMPFILLLLSAVVYRWAYTTNLKSTAFYWRNCLNTLEVVTLLTLYAAGNYFVVRESTALMFDLQFLPGQEIPFAYVFYVLTLAIPVVYIAMGLRNKDRIPLRTGILLFAVSVITYKYYYHFMSPEATMIMAGALLILFSWAVIRALKNPWKGITGKDTGDEEAFIEAESLVIAQTFGAQATKSNDMDFGGGKFGGGGASGKF